MAKNTRNHEDTWGANEDDKQDWDDQNGDAARKATEQANKRRARDTKEERGA